MDLLFILGTRPEAIKLAPLIIATRKKIGKSAKVCLTGQHYELINPILKVFDIRYDFNLHLMQPNQTLNELSARTFSALNKVFKKNRPDFVIVQGDTTTAAISAIAAFYEKIPVIHVEAGLRSFNRYSPFPEEINRRIIATIASMHFAATKLAAKNLLNEGINKKEIFIIGNTVIDALLEIRKRISHNFDLQTKLATEFSFLNLQKKLILVTCHRRESFGKPLKSICRAILNLAKRTDIQIVCSLHYNPNVRDVVTKMLGANKNIRLIDPPDYVAFVYLMSKAYLILTDSGGIQEEAPIFKVPVLVLREETEREEAVKAGCAKLVERNTDVIVAVANLLLNNKKQYAKMQVTKSPFGDGKAVARILKILKIN